MSEEEELSSSEMDDLLRELEAKASANEKSKPAPTEKPTPKPKAAPKKKEKPKKTKQKERSNSDVPLEEAPDQPLVETDQDSAKSKKKKKKKDVSVVERSTSPALKRTGSIIKWSVIILPVLLAMWLIGTYLAQWVSAGWLISLVAIVVVLGIPLGLKLAVKRGSYPLWAGIGALLIVAGLTAPILPTAAQAIAKFGHWPTTTVGALAGLAADSWLIRAGAATSAWTAKTIFPSPDLPVPMELGSDKPLNPADSSPDEKDPSDAKPDETKPDDTKPDDKKPDEAKPDDKKPEDVKPDEKKPEEKTPTENEGN